MDSSWVLPAILLGIGLIANSAFIWRLWSHYHRLTGKINKKELLEALNQLMGEIDQNRQQHKTLEQKFSAFKQESRKNITKIDFQRFNPFSDTGGDQSFCLVLLDANNDGLMISSLHSRENTRLYAKIISNGQSREQGLSREEKEVLKQALKQ